MLQLPLVPMELFRTGILTLILAVTVAVDVAAAVAADLQSAAAFAVSKSAARSEVTLFRGVEQRCRTTSTRLCGFSHVMISKGDDPALACDANGPHFPRAALKFRSQMPGFSRPACC